MESLPAYVTVNNEGFSSEGEKQSPLFIHEIVVQKLMELHDCFQDDGGWSRQHLERVLIDDILEVTEGLEDLPAFCFQSVRLLEQHVREERVRRRDERGRRGLTGDLLVVSAILNKDGTLASPLAMIELMVYS